MDCGIPTSLISTDTNVEVLRNDILYGLTRQCIDLMSALCGLRGLLAIESGSNVNPVDVVSEIGAANNRGNSINDYNTGNCSTKLDDALRRCRVNGVNRLISHYVYHTLEPFLYTLVALLSVRDAHTFRRALKVKRWFFLINMQYISFVSWITTFSDPYSFTTISWIDALRIHDSLFLCRLPGLLV